MPKKTFLGPWSMNRRLLNLSNPTDPTLDVLIKKIEYFQMTKLYFNITTLWYQKYDYELNKNWISGIMQKKMIGRSASFI